MKLEHSVSIDAPRERVWAFLMDVPSAARCVPGVESVSPEGDAYRGAMKVQVGPVRLGLDGDVRVVAQDEAAGTATLRVDAADKKLGGAVHADVALALAGSAPTAVRITSDVQILGRIGELGQPLMKRKADQVMNEFAQNVRKALA